MSDKFKGKITISRPSGGARGSCINIAIVDENSGVEFFDGEMSLEDFAMALTGHGYMEIEFEFRWPELVGMKAEHKTELVRFDRYSDKVTKERRKLESYDRSASTDAALAEFEVDGWRGNVSDLLNGHRREGEFQRVSFHRHINPKTGKPILK